VTKEIALWQVRGVLYQRTKSSTQVRARQRGENNSGARVSRPVLQVLNSDSEERVVVTDVRTAERRDDP